MRGRVSGFSDCHFRIAQRPCGFVIAQTQLQGISRGAGPLPLFDEKNSYKQAIYDPVTSDI